MLMPRFHFSVISEYKYPVETKGYTEVSGWRAAAGKAVKAHLDDMKAKGKGKRLGDKLLIRLFKMPKEIEETPKENT
jgi:hypothetical protein